MTRPIRCMRLAVGAGWLLAAALTAAAPPATTVELAPAAAAKMPGYGEEERAVLSAAIVAAVGRETAGIPAAGGLAIAVTIEDVAPTHPTREQLANNPAVDTVRTTFLGGAELTGEVRDADQRLVAKVTDRYFARSLELGSRARDPWADARLAIDRFALKLADACRRLPDNPGHGT